MEGMKVGSLMEERYEGRKQGQVGRRERQEGGKGRKV